VLKTTDLGWRDGFIAEIAPKPVTVTIPVDGIDNRVSMLVA